MGDGTAINVILLVVIITWRPAPEQSMQVRLQELRITTSKALHVRKARHMILAHTKPQLIDRKAEALSMRANRGGGGPK